MSRIACVGSALQDTYMLDRDDFEGVELDAGVSIFGKIAIGSKIDIDKVIYEVGGAGTNAAVTFARTGHETILMSNIGRDAAGDAVMECLDRENIDSSYIEYVEGHTGCSVVLLDVRAAERTILTYRGASASFRNLNPDDLENIHPDWLYMTSLRGDMQGLLAFFEKAHELGAKVMFNPGELELAPENLRKTLGLLDLVDVLLVNKEEAAQLVPGVVLTELVAHLSNYCPIVLITDGMMGAIASNRQEVYRLGVYEQERLRDRTGAGDAFGSGFLAKWADGASFEDALWFAAANASKVTQHYGAKAGIMTGTEVLHPMPIQKTELKPSEHSQD